MHQTCCCPGWSTMAWFASAVDAVLGLLRDVALLLPSAGLPVAVLAGEGELICCCNWYSAVAVKSCTAGLQLPCCWCPVCCSASLMPGACARVCPDLLSQLSSNNVVPHTHLWLLATLLPWLLLIMCWLCCYLRQTLMAVALAWVKSTSADSHVVMTMAVEIAGPLSVCWALCLSPTLSPHAFPFYSSHCLSPAMLHIPFCRYAMCIACCPAICRAINNILGIKKILTGLIHCYERCIPHIWMAYSVSVSHHVPCMSWCGDGQ